MSYAEMCHVRLQLSNSKMHWHVQLSSSKCTGVCSMLIDCTLAAAVSAAGLSAGQPSCAQLLPDDCGGPHSASRCGVAASG